MNIVTSFAEQVEDTLGSDASARATALSSIQLYDDATGVEEKNFCGVASTFQAFVLPYTSDTVHIDRTHQI